MERPRKRTTIKHEPIKNNRLAKNSHRNLSRNGRKRRTNFANRQIRFCFVSAKRFALVWTRSSFRGKNKNRNRKIRLVGTKDDGGAGSFVMTSVPSLPVRPSAPLQSTNANPEPGRGDCGPRTKHRRKRGILEVSDVRAGQSKSRF
jgi:hypothetical protein